MGSTTDSAHSMVSGVINKDGLVSLPQDSHPNVLDAVVRGPLKLMPRLDITVIPITVMDITTVLVMDMDITDTPIIMDTVLSDPESLDMLVAEPLLSPEAPKVLANKNDAIWGAASSE